jgi:hypothetical protein
MRLFMGMIALTVATGASIRDVDFKNVSIPFIYHRFISVPNKLRWMPLTGVKAVPLRNGRYTFLCDGDPCYLLTLDDVVFGNINGLPGTIALAVVTFHTGGTATWQYLYLIALRSGKPRIAAWLETGSRADMGLRRAFVDHGELVLIVNDPDKREGDCCSTGTITYRYKWQDRSFHQIGAPILADDPQ